jgi:hypothetical protein
MAGVRLKRLRIDKYRNVAPGTELHFSDGFNVLLGKNGTGKTTLLSLIGVLASDTLGPLAGNPLDITYTLAFEGVTATARIQNERIDEPVFVKESYLAWSFSIGFELSASSQLYAVKASSRGSAKPEYTIDGTPLDSNPSLSVLSPFLGRFLGLHMSLFASKLPAHQPWRADLSRAALAILDTTGQRSWPLRRVRGWIRSDDDHPL